MTNKIASISIDALAAKVGIITRPVTMLDVAQKVGFNVRPIGLNELAAAVENYLTHPVPMTKAEMEARIEVLSHEMDANDEENRMMQDEIDGLYVKINALAGNTTDEC